MKSQLNLYERIHGDMISEYKKHNDEIVSMLKFILSEIQRSPNKDYSDEAVTIVIKRNVTAFEENIYVDHTRQIQYLKDNYLPQQITYDDIVNFVNTIDFSQLKNKKIAVGMVKSHFPVGSVDMKLVNEIVDKH